MIGRAWWGWPLAGAAAVVLASPMPSPASDDAPGPVAQAGQTTPAAAGASRGYRLLDTRLSDPTAGLAVQATGAPGTVAAAPAAEDAGGASASELNRQLSNPVTSLWSLTLQFNNFLLENHRWNNNLQFQPVLPISLTKDWNLITRPVIPLYNIVPHETTPGQFERTAGLGDIVLLELISPANTGEWILGAGPTFIFPSATSKFTGQGKWQAGPGLVVGYLTERFIIGVFPQQWWSFAGQSDRADTSQMNLQPFAAVFCGEGWSVGYSGNILANSKAPSGEKWTVPVGVAVGKVLKLGPLPIRVQLAAQYMPIRPQDGQEWNFQLVLTPVIPKLIKEPLFR